MSGVSIVLLCEDSQTNSFVRRFLKRRHFGHRDITTLPLPDGSGSGEQWVRERYPDQLRAIRGRQAAYLIVVTDADTRSSGAIRAGLDAHCREKHVPPRVANDPVIMAVPRRNIETWFAYLDGNEVDEASTYPKLARERDCDRHAQRLHAMCHEEQRLVEPSPPSLAEACQEYARLRR